MVDYEAIELRRKHWDASYPFFGGCGNSRNLHEKLKLYVRTVKHEEDDSTDSIRKLENLDGVVAEILREIRKRSQEDDQIEEDKPNPQEVRKQKGRALKKELQKTIDRHPDSMVLISKEDLESEAEIAGNPARKFEQSSGQELLRNVDKELKSVLQRSSRPRPEEDTVSEELDSEPREGDQNDKNGYEKTVTMNEKITSEMKKAVERLLPADNYIIAEKIRKRMKS